LKQRIDLLETGKSAPNCSIDFQQRLNILFYLIDFVFSLVCSLKHRMLGQLNFSCGWFGFPG
jgi:hypothetical protein